MSKRVHIKIFWDKRRIFLEPEENTWRRFRVAKVELWDARQELCGVNFARFVWSWVVIESTFDLARLIGSSIC